MALEALATLGLPHQPELEDVGPAAALHVLVAEVEARVVELIRLEEVGGLRAVRRLQQPLVPADVSARPLQPPIWAIRFSGKFDFARASCI